MMGIIVCLVFLMCIVGLYVSNNNSNNGNDVVDIKDGERYELINWFTSFVSDKSNIGIYIKDDIKVEMLSRISGILFKEKKYSISSIISDNSEVLIDCHTYTATNPSNKTIQEIKDIVENGQKCEGLIDFSLKVRNGWCTDGDYWYSFESSGSHLGEVVRVDDVINCESLKTTRFYKEHFPVGVLKGCDNPRKQYWERFLEKEMLDKQKRDLEMKEWVDTIIIKHQKYNDLQYKYECLPSAPIDDIDGFKSFCKLVHEGIKYNKYEISNYLMLKVSEKRFNNMLETTRKQFP